jgi:hypothetical protein
LDTPQIRSKIPATLLFLRETFFYRPRIAFITSNHADDKSWGGLIVAFAA